MNNNLSENKNMKHLDEFINRIVRQVINEAFNPDPDQDYNGNDDDKKFRDYHWDNPDDEETDGESDTFLNTEMPDNGAETTDDYQLNTGSYETPGVDAISDGEGADEGDGEYNDNEAEAEAGSEADADADTDIAGVKITPAQKTPVEAWIHEIKTAADNGDGTYDYSKVDPTKSRKFGPVYAMLYSNPAFANAVEHGFSSESASKQRRYEKTATHYKEPPIPLKPGIGRSYALDVFMEFMSGKCIGNSPNAFVGITPQPSKNNPNPVSNVERVVISFEKNGVQGLLKQFYRQLFMYARRYAAENYDKLAGIASGGEIAKFDKLGTGDSDTVQFDRGSDFIDYDEANEINNSVDKTKEERLQSKDNYLGKSLKLLKRIRDKVENEDYKNIIDSSIWAIEMYTNERWKTLGDRLTARLEQRIQNSPAWTAMQDELAKQSEKTQINSVVSDKTIEKAQRLAYFRYCDMAIKKHQPLKTWKNFKKQLDHLSKYIEDNWDNLTRSKTVSEQRKYQTVQRLINEVVRRTLQQYLR